MDNKRLHRIDILDFHPPDGPEPELAVQRALEQSADLDFSGLTVRLHAGRDIHGVAQRS